jgi:hypothetical protein
MTNPLTALANAQPLDGTITDALATIEKALQANKQRPEALTTRGELWLKTDKRKRSRTTHC